MKRRFQKHEFIFSNPLFKQICESHRHDFFAPYNQIGEVYQLLPQEHLWRFDTEYSIIALSEDASIPELQSHINEVSNAYMNDLRVTILGLGWKCEELTANAINSINKGHYLSAAVLARSILEATVVSASLYARLCEADAQIKQTGDFVKFLQNLHENTRKILWGRRYKTRVPTIQTSNILSHMETYKKLKIMEASSDKYFDDVYEFLSNVAHPSADGHQFFWQILNNSYENESKPHWIQLRNSNRSDLEYLEQFIFSIGWSLTFSAAKITRIWDLIKDFEFEQRVVTRSDFQKYKQETYRKVQE